MKNLFLPLITLFLPLLLNAQDTSIEMADIMRSNGKIYVVVAIILVIFIGLALYLLSVEKKVDKIEREL